MSQSWPEVELGDVLQKVVGGGTPSRGNSAFWAGDIPWATVKDMKDGEFKLSDTQEFITELGLAKSASNLIPAGTVITSTRMGLGRCFIASCPVAINQDLKALFPTKAIDSRYLLWLMVSRAGEIQGMGTGTTVSGIRLEQLRSIRFPLPPLPTQRKIAAVLSAYDDLIENNTRRVRVLEEMARALYREWFVEYRFPGHEQAEFVEDEQGRRPKGWERVTVGDVALVHRGRSYKKENLVEEGGMPFINLKCIERDGGFRMDGIKRYDGPLKPSQTVMPDDIVMGVTDMTQERRIVARAARIPRLAEPAAVSMDLVKIQPRADVTGSYLYGMFRFSDFADEVKLHANGANVLHLSPDRITSFEFALPPESLRNHYGRLASAIYTNIDVLNLRNANLRRTRDLLLPRLVSGELDVSELEIAGVAEAQGGQEEAVA